jgi:hypothetical protein
MLKLLLPVASVVEVAVLIVHDLGPVIFVRAEVKHSK